MSQRRVRVRAVLLATASLVFSAAATAQSSAQSVALAETLFRDAQKLMHAGNYAEACPKFAESQRVDPAGGTLMNLAACHEAAGLLASAWAEFTDAAAWARREGRLDRLPIIEQRLAELEPRLSKLTLAVEHPLRGLEVRLDDSVIGASAFNTPIPVNPGHHTVRATAPGFRAFSTELEIGAEKDARRFDVPPLVRLPAAPPARAESASGKPPPPRDRSLLRGERLAGVVTAGTGITLVGVGGVFGVEALSKMSQSDAACPQGRCSALGAKRSREANTAANFANVFIGAGLAATGVGAYLYLTGGRKERRAASIVLVPTFGAAEGELVVAGGELVVAGAL